MNTESHSFLPSAGHPGAHQAGAGVGDPMVEMQGLMNRLLEDPDADAVLMPQILRVSEALPAGPAKGALESSVEAMSRLRAWLRQLQARQRLTNRFSDITSRLSRVDGLEPLMQSLIDEARRMLDAPLARLDAFPPLLLASADSSVRVCSGEFISRLPQIDLRVAGGVAAQAIQGGAPVIVSDIMRLSGAGVEGELEQQARVEGLHGMVLIPLVSEGKCCGLLTVADRMVRQWMPMDIEALQHLATVAVRAIGRSARADAAQHALQALHERHRQMRLSQDRHDSAMSSGGDVTLFAGDPPGRDALSGLIRNMSPAQRESFMREVIGPLLKADQSRGTSLALTLLTYMDHGHNARAAARVLGVHVNTLHNRLETIGGLMPGWNQPGRCLEVHLALSLNTEIVQATRRMSALAINAQEPGEPAAV